jgi:hypothetical protein
MGIRFLYSARTASLKIIKSIHFKAFFIFIFFAAGLRHKGVLCITSFKETVFESNHYENNYGIKLENHFYVDHFF